VLSLDHLVCGQPAIVLSYPLFHLLNTLRLHQYTAVISIMMIMMMAVIVLVCGQPAIVLSYPLSHLLNTLRLHQYTAVISIMMIMIMAVIVMVVEMGDIS